MDIYKEYPGGESFMTFYERIKSVIPYLDKLEDDTLIVTHRGVINMLYFIMHDRLPDNDKKQFGVTHASVHVLDLKNKIIMKVGE
jgi:probable phosphoglycerate mutase